MDALGYGVGVFPAAGDESVDAGSNGSYIVGSLSIWSTSAFADLCSGYNNDSKYRIPHTSMTKRFIEEGLGNQAAVDDKMESIHEEKFAEGRVERVHEEGDTRV